MPVYKRAKRVSIYLSTETEVNTIDILRQMFRDMKEVSNFCLQIESAYHTFHFRSNTSTSLFNCHFNEPLYYCKIEFRFSYSGVCSNLQRGHHGNGETVQYGRLSFTTTHKMEYQTAQS